MISTVTTSTITTLTNTALAGTLGLIAVVVLMILLVQKEVTSTATGKRTARLSRALNIAIVPLLIVFVTVAITRVVLFLQ